MLSRWPTNPFGIVPSAPTATLVLTFHSFPNSLARSWYLAIFSFSFCSTLASPGTAMLIIWQTACCLSTTTRSGLLWSSWGSVYMLKSQRIFTFSDSQASRDMLIPLVSNFQFVLTAQASMDTFCNTIMSNFIFSLSQCWAFTNYVAYRFLGTLAQPAFWARSLFVNLCLLLHWFEMPGPEALLTILLSPS